MSSVMYILGVVKHFVQMGEENKSNNVVCRKLIKVWVSQLYWKHIADLKRGEKIFFHKTKMYTK